MVQNYKHVIYTLSLIHINMNIYIIYPLCAYILQTASLLPSLCWLAWYARAIAGPRLGGRSRTTLPSSTLIRLIRLWVAVFSPPNLQISNSSRTPKVQRHFFLRSNIYKLSILFLLEYFLCITLVSISTVLSLFASFLSSLVLSLRVPHGHFPWSSTRLIHIFEQQLIFDNASWQNAATSKEATAIYTSLVSAVFPLKGKLRLIEGSLEV